MKKKIGSLLLTLALLCALCAPALGYSAPYTAIADGAWYAEAAMTAIDSGLLNRLSLDSADFQPNEPVTRGQLEAALALLGQKEPAATSDSRGVTRAEAAVLLAGFAQAQGVTVADNAASPLVRDRADIPADAVAAMDFCCVAGILDGDGKGNLNPNAALTWAELVQMLSNLSKVTPLFVEQRVSVENDGRTVPAVVTLPFVRGARGVVMNHGHGGSKDENTGFVGIARALAREGIATIRMDFPGCGESTEPFTENTLSNMISDSNACRAYLVEECGVSAEQMGLLGYSMGGRVASMIVNAQSGDWPYEAVVLLAGAVGEGKFKAEGIAGGAASFDTAYKTAKTEGKYTITTQYGQVQDLSQAWFDDMVSSKPLEHAGEYTLPVLVLYGDKDTVVPAEENKLSLTAYPNAKEVVVPEADHGYGFYSDQPDVTARVEGSISIFFSQHLKHTVPARLLLETPDSLDWFATGKTAYTIEGTTVSKVTPVHNDLEDADYEAQPGTDVVLTGTVGEQWVTPLGKVLKTYTRADGSALTEADFAADVPVKLYAKAGTGNFAAFVPKDMLVEVQTAWGDVLQCNTPGISHGEGDYLVCSAGEDGKPDLSDVWVVNGEVFPNTYQMPQK